MRKCVVMSALVMGCLMLAGCFNLTAGTDYVVTNGTLVTRNGVADMYTEVTVQPSGVAIMATQVSLMEANDSNRYTDCETKYALAHETPSHGNISGSVRPNRNMVICMADDARSSTWNFNGQTNTSDEPAMRLWRTYMGGYAMDRVGMTDAGPLFNDMDAANPPNPGPPPSPLSQWRNMEAYIRQMGYVNDNAITTASLSVKVDRITATVLV